VPLTVVNTRGFDLPQTGSNGNWMFPVLGLSVMALAGTVILILRKKK
jgi:LPXTG-motif cell wall-anchored protein